jgi:hypothetical protein
VVVSDAHPNHPTLQSLLVAIYVNMFIEISCFLVEHLSKKLVAHLEPFQTFGSKTRTIILGGIVGAFIQATSFSYVQIIVTRLALD